MMVKRIEAAMKCTLVAVSLMVGLAVAGREGPSQNQHEERTGKTQDSIRWQFDTHG